MKAPVTETGRQRLLRVPAFTRKRGSLLLRFPALLTLLTMGAGLQALTSHALAQTGHDGWFQVGKSDLSQHGSADVDTAALPDNVLLPADPFSLPGSDAVQAMDNGILPGIRHEPADPWKPVTRTVSKQLSVPPPRQPSAGTDTPGAATQWNELTRNPATAVNAGKVANSANVAKRVNAVDATNVGVDSSVEPLVLSLGEIQEIGDQPDGHSSRSTDDRSPTGTSSTGDAQQNLVRQRLRNRLPPSSVNTINVDMFAGEVKVLGKVDVSRVAIGNGDIVRAEVLKTGELLVIGETEGSTSLRLWHKDKTQSDYNIRVSGSDPETRVRMETMVRMRVRMIEFRKSALGKLGIDWSDSAAGPGLAVAGDALGNNLFRLPGEELSDALPNTVKPFSTYFGVASSITSRINFLASTGDATTLAEPVLSTTNGGTASFLAGGEVPYPSVGANGQTVVQFKEYGIKLNVTPRIDALGNVRTQVDTEISQLDPAVSVQGAPGLLTRRAQTQVNVRSGETIVISGLLSSESSKDVDKLPGIGNLPVIGSFFRSKNARNAVSELVIFVTPEVIEPDGQLLNQRQQDFLSQSDQRQLQAQRQIRLLD